MTTHLHREKAAEEIVEIPHHVALIMDGNSTLPMPLGGGLADLIGIRKMMLILACITLGAAAASVHHMRS